MKAARRTVTVHMVGTGSFFGPFRGEKCACPLARRENRDSPRERFRRTGFSLMEVLLATSLLLGCLVVLGELAAVGRRHAYDAEHLTAAQLICQTKLNEILAGVELVSSVQDQPLEEAPGWVYSVEVESLDRLGLASVRVTVSEDLSELDGAANPRPAKQFTLTRWIRDPYQQTTAGPDSDSLLVPPLGESFGGTDLHEHGP